MELDIGIIIPSHGSYCNMYIGRFIIITPSLAAYRVSSRSFPERKIITRDDGEVVTVVPTSDAEPTDNPYISYNCARAAGQTIVVGNGSHVDPITEKLTLGYPARDALALGLLAMDYEKDAYNTPRIAGTVGDSAYIGIVRDDAVLVEPVTGPTIVATYEKNTPEPIDFDATTPETAATEIMALPFEHGICATAVTADETGSVAIENTAEN